MITGAQAEVLYRAEDRSRVAAWIGLVVGALTLGFLVEGQGIPYIADPHDAIATIVATVVGGVAGFLAVGYGTFVASGGR